MSPTGIIVFLLFFFFWLEVRPLLSAISIALLNLRGVARQRRLVSNNPGAQKLEAVRESSVCREVVNWIEGKA